jgi:hypothetical protein
MNETYRRLGQLLADITARLGDDKRGIANELEARLEADSALSEAVAKEGGLSHMMDRLSRFLRLIPAYSFEDKKIGDVLTEGQLKELWERSA